MEAYIEFLRNLFAFPAKFQFFRDSAEWINVNFPLLKLTPWEAFILWLCFAVIVGHGGLMIYLWISRRGMSAKDLATGRFSTSSEINKYYRLPGQFLFYSKRFGVLLLVMLSSLIITDSFSETGVLIATVPLLITLGLLDRYTDFLHFEKYFRRLKAIPLGWVGNKRVGVIGNTYWSLFKRKQIRGKQRQEHVLIVGPTGTGKTTTFFIPALIEDAHSNDSCFVIDIKDNEDLVDIVGPEWNKSGKKVICFDPWKKEERLGFNPLFYLEPDLDDPETYYTVQTITDAIYRVHEQKVGVSSAEASYYIGNEQRLVEGLLFAALFHPEHERNLVAVTEALSGTVEATQNFILEAVRVSGEMSKLKVAQLYRQIGWFIDKPMSSQERENPASIETKQNMIKGAHSKMRIFLDPYVKRHFYKPELDLDMMFKEPCLVVVKAPQHQRDTGILLASMITRLVMLRILETGKERQKRGQNVWLYLDEFASLKIPDITTFVATVRSSGGGVVAAVQTLFDLITATKDTARGNSPESLETNFSTMIVLGGLDIKTCQKLTLMLGEKVFLEKSKIQDVWAFFTFRSMKRYSKAPLLTPDSIRCLKDDHALMVPNRKRPFMMNIVPYFDDPKYKKYVYEDPNPFTVLTVQDRLSMEKPMKYEIPIDSKTTYMSISIDISEARDESDKKEPKKAENPWANIKISHSKEKETILATFSIQIQPPGICQVLNAEVKESLSGTEVKLSYTRTTVIAAIPAPKTGSIILDLSGICHFRVNVETHKTAAVLWRPETERERAERPKVVSTLKSDRELVETMLTLIPKKNEPDTTDVRDTIVSAEYATAEKEHEAFGSAITTDFLAQDDGHHHHPERSGRDV